LQAHYLGRHPAPSIRDACRPQCQTYLPLRTTWLNIQLNPSIPPPRPLTHQEYNLRMQAQLTRWEVCFSDPSPVKCKPICGKWLGCHRDTCRGQGSASLTLKKVFLSYNWQKEIKKHSAILFYTLKKRFLQPLWNKYFVNVLKILYRYMRLLFDL